MEARSTEGPWNPVLVESFRRGVSPWVGRSLIGEQDVKIERKALFLALQSSRAAVNPGESRNPNRRRVLGAPWGSVSPKGV